MPNPFSDFLDFLIGNTDDHNALGSWKYLFVVLFAPNQALELVTRRTACERMPQQGANDQRQSDSKGQQPIGDVRKVFPKRQLFSVIHVKGDQHQT